MRWQRRRGCGKPSSGRVLATSEGAISLVSSTSCRHRWPAGAEDVGTTLREFEKSLSAADASPDRDEAPGHDPVAELKDALIRAVAVRDRLRAAAALVFGAKCLTPSARWRRAVSSVRAAGEVFDGPRDSRWEFNEEESAYVKVR